MGPFASLSHDSQTNNDWIVKRRARANATLWVERAMGHASKSLETVEAFMRL